MANEITGAGLVFLWSRGDHSFEHVPVCDNDRELPKESEMIMLSSDAFTLPDLSIAKRQIGREIVGANQQLPVTEANIVRTTQ